MTAYCCWSHRISCGAGNGSFPGQRPCLTSRRFLATPISLHHLFDHSPNSRPNRFCHKSLQTIELQVSRVSCSDASARNLCEFVWSRYFNIMSKWLSQVICMYLCCIMASVAEAHEDYPPPSIYACEDVNSYYAHLEGSKGKAFMRQLHSIIRNHKSLSYNKVWDALKVLDAADFDKPEASSGIVEIYSLRVVPKALAGKPDGWNREHLWPRSYGLTSGPSLTDLHNIHPADVNVNSSRGNKFYGECTSTSKPHKCLKPANKEAAPDTETDRESWAPPTQVRGDIARALMYMAVCYGHHQPGGHPELRLSDSPSIGTHEMGILSTLLRWNQLDPPSREEKLRNERVCKIYQHNRNPFVDHPEYADLIWKSGFSNLHS